MSVRKTLADLQSAFQKPVQGSFAQDDKYFPFWNMEVGKQAIIRFLPDLNEDNPLAFLVPKFTHRFDLEGKSETVPCIYQYEKTPCPICKVSSDYYNAGDKVNGKKFYRNKQHLAQALIVSDPLTPLVNDETGEEYNREGKVCQITIGYNIFKILEDVFKTAELDDVPYLFKGGTDFIIKKEMNGEHPSYTLSKFARKSRDLTELEIQTVEETMVDLSTWLPKKPLMDLLEGLLSHVQDGTPFNRADYNTSRPTSETVETKTTASETIAATTSPLKSPTSEDSSTTEGISSEAQTLLDSIRKKHSS